MSALRMLSAHDIVTSVVSITIHSERAREVNVLPTFQVFFDVG
jgi:hypothetical protein